MTTRHSGHAEEQGHEDPAEDLAIDDLHGLDPAGAAGERERPHDEVREGEEDPRDQRVGQDRELNCRMKKNGDMAFPFKGWRGAVGTWLSRRFGT
jgi:hypothetical protein